MQPSSLFKFAPPEINFYALMPILIVALTGVLALVLEMFRPKKSNEYIVAVSLGGLALAGASAYQNLSMGPTQTMALTLLHDSFSATIHLILVASTFLTIVFSEQYLRSKRIPFGEFYPLVLWSTTGAMIMAATNHLLMIFLGLEILSISLYVMAGLSRGEQKSHESALKYFLLGAFASGFLLYGIAFIYGGSGSLYLGDISQVLYNTNSTKQALMAFGVALSLIGLGFKMSLVPFHQWTPDVYQGAPTNVTAFMATASKIGAFAALVRLLDGTTLLQGAWLPALGVVAALTMTVGNVVALLQRDVKRILGYSSIAQAGYVLVAILAHASQPGVVGTGSITFYLFAYTVMTIGTFAVVSLASRDGSEGTKLEDLHGLWRRSPLAAGALVLFVASLIGFPLTAGFVGKLQIFNDAVRSGLTWLAIVLAINSVISVYYYLSIARAVMTDDQTETAEKRLSPMTSGVTAACVLCIVGVLAGFFLPGVIELFGQGVPR